MIKKAILLILFLLSNQIFSQEFEGRITYMNSCEKIDERNSFDIQSFLVFMGDTTNIITKEGSYKKITNGNFKPYELYNSSNPICYYKEKIKSDTLYFIDYRKFSDFDFEYSIERNSDNILGYACDKLIVTDKNNGSVLLCYFAPDLKQNPNHYKNYRQDNLNKIMELTKSVILRYESLSGGMKITQEAIKIETLKIDNSEFEIPKDAVLIEKSQ
ncbi:hypothetical protein [Flagellimonas marinaquae]|uniref:hypothetical protein n=1 Tax=Flagellimonas marinaquae TaxID=254955 RepID=UPI002075E8AC|nr:hypothetical protein [Allomuricauda aquimarina]USD25801.1 hypothetical protein MJO53_02625 [Allomuricauda aquimarina]